jgi:ADP-ribose diphosphatase
MKAAPMYDGDHCLRRYRALQTEHPDWFDNLPGRPTRIILDPAGIKHAQDTVRAERAAGNFPTDDLRVGALAEDHYIGAVVRDAVEFADGRLGLYNRVVATGGIVVLPIIGDAIALIRIFRHPARRWFFEAPQGLLLPGADPVEETRRELIEEMGTPADEIIPLGIAYTSTALTSENLKMFAARIKKTGAPKRSEVIEAIRIIPKAEIDALVLDGTICDGPTMSLILRARLRGLL